MELLFFGEIICIISSPVTVFSLNKSYLKQSYSILLFTYKNAVALHCIISTLLFECIYLNPSSILLTRLPSWYKSIDFYLPQSVDWTVPRSKTRLPRSSSNVTLTQRWKMDGWTVSWKAPLYLRHRPTERRRSPPGWSLSTTTAESG